MGYDLNIRIRTTPNEHLDAVLNTIEEKHGETFENLYPDKPMSYSEEAWTYDTRWRDLTENMLEISKKHPDTRIEVYVESPDSAEYGHMWCEYFHNGKYRLEQRESWEVPEWNDDLMHEHGAPAPKVQSFTVILQYPDYFCEEQAHKGSTWMGYVHAKDPGDAVLVARGQVMEDLFKSHGENMIENGEDLYTIAVIAGNHNDLSA